MNTITEFTAIGLPAKKIRRQLILFVNLDGVDATKKDLFVKFATERANRLKVNYSAYNIALDENQHLQAIDLKNVLIPQFINEPCCENELKRQQIFDAKIRVMNDFEKNLKGVDGTYDYILVVGEMSRSSSGNSISKIKELNYLANFLKEIITNHSSKHLHLRVQVCFSNLGTLSRTTTSFASSLVPEDKFVHLSAPTGWSIIGRNGTAIDYNLVHDVNFAAWAPFLSYVIMNNLSLKKIIETFHSNELFLRKTNWHLLMNLKKDRPEMTIEALNIKLHYPSQTSEDKVFSELEHYSKNSFLPIPFQSPSRSPGLSRTPSQSSFFRVPSPYSRSTDASPSPKLT